jgi:hypothetical protein
MKIFFTTFFIWADSDEVASMNTEDIKMRLDSGLISQKIMK